MPPLMLPIGQIAKSEREKSFKAKVDNFKQAAEGKKRLIEQGKSNRELRNQVFEECQASVAESEREEKAHLFQAQETRLVRAMFKNLTTRDFEPVCVLGKGAFGTVHLARQREDSRYVALKQLRKERYREKNLRERAYAERHILAEAANRWFVNLLATFQDQENFYMVMEFLQGGDLLTHLERKNRFSEDETRFYMAELLEALDLVHTAGFVHRDIKPDNIVLCGEGHLKLLDFGLCKPDPTAEAPEDDGQCTGAAATRRQQMRSARGTPQYMAPEAIMGHVCPAGDFWAMGVMVYECLYGCVPFHSGAIQGPQGIQMVTLQVKEHAQYFPVKLAKAKHKGYIGPKTEQLLKGLICEAGERLNAEGCRQQPFFDGVDFATIHLQKPPITPELELQGPTDTSFFPQECLELGNVPLPVAPVGPARDAPLEWANYEFNREVHELQKPQAVEALFATKTASGSAASGLQETHVAVTGNAPVVST